MQRASLPLHYQGSLRQCDILQQYKAPFKSDVLAQLPIIYIFETTPSGGFKVKGKAKANGKAKK